MIILGIIYLKQWLKSRARDQVSKMSSDRPMSSLGTPLMSSASQFARTNLVSPSRPLPTRPPLSPLSTNSSEFLRSDSSSSTGSHSPYSPTPENFHFPILSADGHLLPPPISSRRSWVDVSTPTEGERPLPSPPQAASSNIRTCPQNTATMELRTNSRGISLLRLGSWRGGWSLLWY